MSESIFKQALHGSNPSALPVTPRDPLEEFRPMLERLRERLGELTRLRDESVKAAADYEAQIVTARRAFVSYAAMLGEPTELESIGITEACRTVMASAVVPLKLRNVRDLLADFGFDPKQQTNLDQNIQTILNRLYERKEIEKETISTAGGKQIVIYIGPRVTPAQKAQSVKEIRG